MRVNKEVVNLIMMLHTNYLKSKERYLNEISKCPVESFAPGVVKKVFNKITKWE